MAKTTQKRLFLSLAGHSGTYTRKMHTNYSLCTRITDFWFMFKKSAQLAQPNMLQPCLRKPGSGRGQFSIRPKPGSKCFDPDKFGTKISGIRCSTNFSLTTFPQIYQEKSYCRKTCFSTTPKNTFFANKTRASDARVTKTIIFDAPLANA